MAKHGNNNRQAYDRFGGGDGHHKEDHDLPFHRTEKSGKGDERQIDRVKHQLDGHQHDDQVAPDQHANDADDKNDGA